VVALQVRLVGPFTVAVDGRELVGNEIGTRKARTLLKVLAVDPERLVSAETLAEAVWPAQAPRVPGDNLATLVSRLRAVLGADAVRGDRTGWGLGRGVDVDVQVAARLLAQARASLAGGEPGVAAAAAAAAVGRLVGDVLGDERDADWAAEVRAEVARLRRQARHLAAEAALAAGDVEAARASAEAAASEDPLDETAARLAMRADRAAGEPAAGLARFERLRTLLADELGADPAPQTRAVHLELLTEQGGPPGPDRAASPRQTRSAVVGRDVECARMADRWIDAVAGRPAVLLVTGEAGIGKTRVAAELADLARSTGGTVLEARCYDTERSLFLQPFVDAIRPELLRSAPAVLREVAGERAASLALLVPEVAEVVGVPPPEVRSPDAERRLAYEAVVVALRRMSARAPVLLVLDDLHNAALATLELLHLLARRLTTERLLVVATVRTDEGAEVSRQLADVTVRLEVGPLDADAVQQLAVAAGLPELGPSIAARTGGHPLFVVETLRAIRDGDEGVPSSLTAALHSRVARLGPEVAELARAAAVLGTSFEPSVVARLVDAPTSAALRGCERLVEAGLAVVAGRAYEFANDLVQEVLYAATPEPTRHAYHVLAMDLLADRPEASARHAAAAGTWARAAADWLAAAHAAMARFAAPDAERILRQALAAAESAADVELVVRCRLELGRAREAMGAYVDALADLTRGLSLAQSAGLTRLEMLLQREVGGEATADLQPLGNCVPHLEAGLVLAERLGEPAVAADILARLAVLCCNRLDFVTGRRYALRAVEAGRAADDEQALRLGLDGLKTTYAYLGDLDGFDAVATELGVLTRRAGDLKILQWLVFEGMFRPLAAADWEAATAVVEEALALNRRSGRVAYEGWFLAHIGWLARLDGRIDDAVAHGRRAIVVTGDGSTSWFGAAACAMLATTLLSTGDPKVRPEALNLLRRGLSAADRSGAEAYRLRCLAPLAELTASVDLTAQADRMLGAAALPPGSAWLGGAEVYLALARTWLAADQPARALAVLEPFLSAATAAGWTAFLDAVGAPGLRASCRSATRSAPSAGTGT
jgi:DNA-binding SARP family transcriptional activator/tetratricopeptide (TPR) repeat protein